MARKKKNNIVIEETVIAKNETVIKEPVIVKKNTVIQKHFEELKEAYYCRLRQRAFKQPIKFIYDMNKNELINNFKVIKVTKDFKKVAGFKYKIRYFNNFFIAFQDINNFEKFKKNFDIEISYILKVNFEDCWKNLLNNETELVVASNFIKDNKLEEFNLY